MPEEYFVLNCQILESASTYVDLQLAQIESDDQLVALGNLHRRFIDNTVREFPSLSAPEEQIKAARIVWYDLTVLRLLRIETDKRGLPRILKWNGSKRAQSLAARALIIEKAVQQTEEHDFDRNFLHAVGISL